MSLIRYITAVTLSKWHQLKSNNWRSRSRMKRNDVRTIWEKFPFLRPGERTIFNDGRGIKQLEEAADGEAGKENSRGRVQTVSSWRVNIENTRDKWHFLPLERDKAGSRCARTVPREVGTAVRKAGMMIQPRENRTGWLRGRSERVDMNNRSSRDVDLRD